MSDMDEGVVETTGAAVAVKAKVPVVPLVVAVIVSVLLATAGAGGVLFWAAKKGKLPLGNVKTVEVLVKAEPVKTKLYALDPLLVNLADDGGRGYLRVALTLKVEDPPPDKNAKPKEEAPKGAPKNEFEAEERDTALTVLGRETTVNLLAPGGKDMMKGKLKSAFAEHDPEAKVVDVLVTEFLVQR